MHLRDVSVGGRRPPATQAGVDAAAHKRVGAAEFSLLKASTCLYYDLNMEVQRSAGTRADTGPTATLAELGALSDLANESACLDYLRDLLFPSGTACPKCRRPSRFHRVRGRSAYACQYCGYHVYPTAGTIFRRSTTSLRSWFRAVHIVCSRHGAVTAEDLQDELGIARKTALRMLERIVPLVPAGPELVLTAPAEKQPGRPIVTRAESPAAATHGLPAAELVRAELLASLAGLREDLRAAELRAGDARKEVNALRDAVAAIERFSAGGTKSPLL